MHLCTFETTTPSGRELRFGAVAAGGIVDLHAACAWHQRERGHRRPVEAALALVPPSMRAFLQGEDRSMDAARETLDALSAGGWENLKGPGGESLVHGPQSVRLRAPLPDPVSFRDFYAFEQHVKAGFHKRGEQMPPEWYEFPVYYKGNHLTIFGPEDDIRWPAFTEKFDYELEVAVVLGRRGTDIAEEHAGKHIAGYTVLNDFSARDLQRKEMRVRLGPAKGKDWASAIGPVLVTPDEIPDPRALAMRARINGETWSEGSTASMHWSFEQMIAFLSYDDTVYPGELLGSGTVGGGCGLELDRWVQPGDVIELEIERLGVLRNRVVRS